MAYSILQDRAVLAVSGEDARAFLQGLITNDIHKVTEKQAVFAALLSPQGRFLFDFFITEQDGQLLLETDKARLPELKKRLMMYRLRSKIECEERPELQVYAVWGQGSGIRDQLGYTDPRLPKLGTRILSEEIPDFATMTKGDYDAHRISHGVPEGSKDLIIDRSILLEYGYDELHAIDFAKGCYVGQEVTARSKHRATLRKFLHQVLADTPLPASGTLVLAGEQEAGVMAGSVGNAGLALLRVEAVQKGTKLEAAGIALKANLPSWCNTSFAEAVK